MQYQHTRSNALRFGKDVVYDVPNSVLMEQKKFVKFGLSAENLRMYVDMIADETLKFLNRDNAFSAYQSKDVNGGDFHCFQTMSEITILTASRTLQGKEVRDGLDKSFADMYHDLDGGFTPLNVSVVLFAVQLSNALALAVHVP